MHELKTKKLQENMDSIHRLIILADKRAKQLSKGALPMVEKVSPNLGIVALEEYAQGKLKWASKAEVDQKRATRPGRKAAPVSVAPEGEDKFDRLIREASKMEVQDFVEEEEELDEVVDEEIEEVIDEEEEEEVDEEVDEEEDEELDEDEED